MLIPDHFPAGASGQQLAPSTIMAAPYFLRAFLHAAHALRPHGNSANHAGMILRMPRPGGQG
jgi:hypothetical protein